ncbi:MAG: protein kinase [Thermoanaerobaculia bacterium]|nr:protein kinase [Thermoanaerobaculia bacterium]
MIFRDYVRLGDQQFQKGNLRKAAEFYAKGERYEQAARLFEKLNLVDEAVETYEKARLFLAAGDLLEREGRSKDAVRHFDRAGNYRRAAEASLRGGLKSKAGDYFVKAEMYDRAAKCYAEDHHYDSALRALALERRRLAEEQFDETLPLVRHENRLRQLDLQRVELLVRLDRRGQAAEILKEANLPERAAAIHEQDGDLEEAAEAYLLAGRGDSALELMHKTDSKFDGDLIARIYASAGRDFEAGEALERLGRHEDAARAFEDAGALARAATLWEAAEQYDQSADLFYRAGRFVDAGRNYAMAGEDQKAADSFVRGESHLDAAAAFQQIGRTLEAGEQLILAGRMGEARQVLQSIGEDDPDHARASLLLVPALVEARPRLVDAARDRLRIVKASGGELSRMEILYAEGRVHEASGDLAKAEHSYQLVLGEAYDYRDAGKRLMEVRQRIAEQKGERRPRAGASPSDSRQTGSYGSSQSGTFPTLDAGRLSQITDSGSFEMPLTGLARLDHPWWSGAVFMRGADRETGDAKLMASFPLALVGDRVDGFRVAMRAVEGVRHQAVLRLEQTIVVSDKVVLLYEDFPGRPLSSVLAEGHVIPPLDALRFLLQLTEALINAHKLGVTHQWLSPDTILVGEGGDMRCKLTGLGLREFLRGHDDGEGAQYLSPEALEDGVVGPASDAFSVGRLAFRLLGGKLPAGWKAGDELDADDVKWPEVTREAIPPASLGFLARSLLPEPLQRPSVQELTISLSAAGLLEGQMLADRYEVMGELGRGGMSRVYSARDTVLDDEVAIKTVITPALGRSEDEERLLREVQISRRISHKNVVRVFDLGRFPGGIFVIMELLDGPGLDSVISEEAPMPLDRTRRILSEVTEALGEAHRLQIVHRDLKPGNVILVNDQVKVLDFGIARVNDGSSHQLTRTGEVIGSPLYMSPEQIQGLPLTGACDLYALGVIAYAMLTGRDPFYAESPTAVIFKQLNEPAPDIRHLRTDLPQAWVDILDCLLQKKPQKRFSSAETLLEALEQLPV